MIDETFDYPEYLAIKQAIDNKSLDQNVWRTMSAWLKRYASGDDFRILEIGAGTGSMLIRLLDADLLDNVRYFAVELEPDFARVAKNELTVWAETHDYTLIATEPYRWSLRDKEKRVEIHWVTADILEIGSLFESAYFDMLIGHAIIDLLPVPACMPTLLDLVKSGGSYYFSLNYAGETSFSPFHPLDFEITRAYHLDMDKRFPNTEWRASQTGKVLGVWLKQQGQKIVAQGDSPWRLSAKSSPAAVDNRFIGNILDTMEKALDGLDGLEDWLRLRRQQANSGTLLFFASNRDLFGRTGMVKPVQGKESDT